MVLTRSQARGYYDRFGRKQDTQAFYEDAAIDDLVAHACFEQAESVFEFGCGTGRLASRLLTEHLPPSASYFGIDLSQTMVDLAKKRLAPFAERARVVLTDGSLRLPLGDRSVDRVISTYVLDLLSETDIRQFMEEAHRVLDSGGRLCLISLTFGEAPLSRLISGLWSALFDWRALWVGGCRPIRLESFIAHRDWSIRYRNVVTQFGVSSEVLVANPREGAEKGSDQGN